MAHGAQHYFVCICIDMIPSYWIRANPPEETPYQCVFILVNVFFFLYSVKQIAIDLGVAYTVHFNNIELGIELLQDRKITALHI